MTQDAHLRIVGQPDSGKARPLSPHLGALKLLRCEHGNRFERGTETDRENGRGGASERERESNRAMIWDPTSHERSIFNKVKVWLSTKMGFIEGSRLNVPGLTWGINLESGHPLQSGHPQVLFQRESSLLTTYWSESTNPRDDYSGPALRHGNSIFFR